MSKDSRSGGKFGGSHTTCIPLAATIVDIAHKSKHVSKIVVGFIKAGLKSANGNRRVKITDDTKSLLLSIRDNTSHQEVRVFASDLKEAMADIEHGARKVGVDVMYREGPQ